MLEDLRSDPDPHICSKSSPWQGILLLQSKLGCSFCISFFRLLVFSHYIFLVFVSEVATLSLSLLWKYILSKQSESETKQMRVSLPGLKQISVRQSLANWN